MKRLATWSIIVVVLAFFSTAMLGASFKGHRSVGSAVDALSATAHGGPVVVLERRNGLLDRVKGHVGLGAGLPVCSVSTSALAQLRERFETSMSVVDGVRVVSIHQADPALVRELLGSGRCKLAKEQGVYFLPFDPHTS